MTYLLLHHLVESTVPTDAFGDGAPDRELPHSLEEFIDAWVTAETMNEAELTNSPIDFSKVPFAETRERM